MTQKQYVSRPNVRTDSAALWLWLERNRPELLEEFKLAFVESAVIVARVWEEAVYPELVRYLLRVPLCKEA